MGGRTAGVGCAYIYEKQTDYYSCTIWKQTGPLDLPVASLLVAVEEVVLLLVARPLQVQGEDDEGGQEGGEDEAVVVKAKGLFLWEGMQRGEGGGLD